ncbi:sugar phosphate nucleotidyltransferase [Halomonas sp. LR5S13]|uniref:sugar phosphate nucleotidyltransferase n=1 Tax=Halomonas rhizosphaerae TaxID=3043296 RepID=UPI0024A9B9ED|nr:sugar phosphate nucleotidyltransferase [Halomonas rhizosphaerae]MDI5920867.1 sugar phosphate nucleotidyltransferase [Halomonas rhizosphaerae]
MLDALLIDEHRKVLDALHQLEETQLKILFVTDREGRLVGTLTDGDIRRWILGGGNLGGEMGDVCNRTPCVVHGDQAHEVLKNIMRSRQVTSVPVLDDDGRVNKVVFWEDLFTDDHPEAAEHEPLGVPVVVMAGGKGTRLAPFTSVLPKPLIPVGDRTAIQVILDSFAECGVDEFYLSVNYKSKLIQAYFEELSPDYRLHYVLEDEPLGTGGGLHVLSGVLDGDLIVTNCDVIIKADYRAILDHHRREKNDITMVVSLRNYDIPYGICDIVDNGQLCAMREKPSYNFLVNTGLYVLSSSILGMIPCQQFYHLTDLIDDVRQKGGRVGVFPISDTAWMDTGEWQQYCETMARLA